MTSVAPAPRPSPCPSDQQELASHSQSPVTREAWPRHGTGRGRAEAREGPYAAAAEGRLMRPAGASQAGGIFPPRVQAKQFYEVREAAPPDDGLDIPESLRRESAR